MRRGEFYHLGHIFEFAVNGVFSHGRIGEGSQKLEAAGYRSKVRMSYLLLLRS